MTLYIRDLGSGKHAVVCPWAAEHTTETGDTSTVIFDGTNGRPQAFVCKHSHCKNRTVRDVYEFFQVTPTQSKPPANARRAFNFEPIAKLLTEPEEKIPWLIENLLPLGGTSIFAAKPKAGKTTMTGQMAVAVARGEAFLGRAVAKGRVLHLAVEEKRSELIRRYRAQGAKEEDDILIHAASAPDEALVLLEAVIQELRPQLVIVDTLFKVVRIENGNDYAEVNLALEPFHHLARTYGAHIMLVHHMGKGENRAGADGILGSTALAGAVDTLLLLDRKDQQRTLKTVQRYGEDLEEAVLHFDKESLRCSLGEPAKAERRNKLADQVLLVVSDSQTSLDFEAIYEAVGGKRQGVVDALKILVDEGKVLRSGSGRRGDPYRHAAHPTWLPKC